MKRIIAAVSFVILALPALAAEHGAPFEQTELDRALPQVEITSQARDSIRFAALGGNTVSDASIAADAQSVWANDFNFIAPAQ